MYNNKQYILHIIICGNVWIHPKLSTSHSQFIQVRKYLRDVHILYYDVWNQCNQMRKKCL